MKTFLIDEELRDKLALVTENGIFDYCQRLRDLPEAKPDAKPDAKGLLEGLSDLELKMQSLKVAIANDSIDARTLLQKISALSTNSHRWIPVSDRLPEEDGYYICWWPGLQHPAFQCFWDGFTWRNTNAPTVMPVTHWQHLPEAPNE